MAQTDARIVRTTNAQEAAHYKLIRDMNVPSKKRYWRSKRFFDVLISLMVLLLSLPFSLIICLAIVLEDPQAGPVFMQTRSGRGGKPFRMYKFRSMYWDADDRKAALVSLNEMSGPVFKIKNDPRVTRVGRILRKTNLDELPQFLNVLKGNMSIVGPRPPLPSEVAQYNEYQFQRLYATPGITCYWQIAPHRNEISFDAWVEMDIEYIIERSFWVDVKIILRTILAVFKRSGS